MPDLMGADTDILVSRLEVVRVGRRRRRTDAEKLRIVSESMAGRRQASATARRHGISRLQLNKWRELARKGRRGDVVGADAPTFAPVVFAAEGSAPQGGARIAWRSCWRTGAGFWWASVWTPMVWRDWSGCWSRH
jgi:hypothetical protein